jgi:hypothetical protein
VLPYPLMGALALAIVWVNALLIAAAALKELGPIGRWRRAAERGMLRGEVVRGLGPNGAFAVRRVEQVGRATDADEIVFADKKYASEIFGGTVKLEGGKEIEIASVPEAIPSPIDLEDGAIEVWPSDATIDAATRRPDDGAFDVALGAAKKARGFGRTVELTIGASDVVYVVVEDNELGGAPRLVASEDPGRWAAKKRAIVLGFITAELAAAGVATAVALVPPAFGLVSKLGGALCLGYFLGVQPIGTLVRDAVRSPARRALRGRWARAKTADPSRADAHH